MKFSSFIATRFMIGGKGAGVSRFTGWVAITGMLIGCLALITAVAVLQGFETQVVRKIIGFEGDLRVHVYSENDFNRVISEIPEIRIVMPFTERRGLVSRPGEATRLANFKAIDMEAFHDFYDISIPNLDSTINRPVYIGQTMAMRMNARVGDELKLLSPLDQQMLFGLPKSVGANIAGIFKAGVLQYDDDLVFIPSDLGNQIFHRKPGRDGWDIRLFQSGDAQKVKSLLENRLEGIKVETWAEMHSALFSAMAMERIGAMAILSLIIIVASFNLSTTLILVTFQKVREFGILRAMGATRTLLKKIIFRQGLFIGGSGALTGISLGVVIVIVQNELKVIQLPPDIYFTDSLPMVISLTSMAFIIGIAAICILLASFIAARRIQIIDPLTTLFLEK